MDTATVELVACVKCLVRQPVSEFYAAPMKKSGRFAACKACTRTRQLDSYHASTPSATRRSAPGTQPCTPPTMKPCRGCGVTRLLTDYCRDRYRPDGRHIYCRQCRSLKTIEAQQPIDCTGCPATFVPSTSRQTYCTKRCRTVDEQRRGLIPTWNSDKARATRHGVDYEPVNRIAVFDRDQWMCGICHEGIDRTAPYPHPSSASLDHVVPLSLGGPHSVENCQATHLRCNQSKGNRATPLPPSILLDPRG